MSRQREVDRFELEADFLPLATVTALSISQDECALVQAALEASRHPYIEIRMTQ